MFDEPIEGNRVLSGRLIPELDLMFRRCIARPLRYHMVSDGEHVAESEPDTNPDANLGRGLVNKGRW